MNDRSTSRFRRAAAVIAGLAAASVALSGCLYAMIPEQASRPAAPIVPDTDGVAEDLLPFYSQELEWTDCGPGFDCTEVTAPLDWENPTAGEITLSVIRHRAQSTAIGSLLTNPGGPGSSGVELVRDNLDFAVGADLIENYDAFAEACEANSEGILPHVTTMNAARDMDLIRAVLGDKQLNYLGYSYGTFLGATYAQLYPEKAGRLVLDGAIDPAVPGLEVGATQALGFESALRAYMQNCLDSGDCPFNGTVDEAMTDLGALLASVDRTPLENGDGRMMGADSLLTAIIAALYSQDSWDILTQALDEALQGDPTTAFLLADFYNNREDGAYINNSSEAFRAYNCMDYPVEDDPAAEAAIEAKIADGAPTIAPYWTGPDSCEVWPYPPTGTRGEITAEGAGPILVIGTTNDPATPYEWSESLADQLEEGVLITRVGEGHTGYNKGNICVDDAVEAFLLDDVVPDDGLRCE
ncbi:MAG: peptidase [Microbacterium sp.]|nr:peptidase [Microbacterium sp.]